jgi:putative ABC transport system ATP-binding protein
MYHLENVTKTYRKRQQQVVAVQNTSLAIGAGEYVAIIGASGSGKTTLLSLLGGMLSPDEGRVLLEGESLHDLPISERTARRRSLIGFVFQTFNLIPYLTALENVMVPLFLAGAPQAEHRARASSLLEQVGLGNRLDHKPSELSTGQQQRVALARTLVNNPRVILADEPTGNLDPESRALVLQMFEQFVAAGRTVIMVTHDPAAAAKAGRRLQICDGAISELPRTARVAA